MQRWLLSNPPENFASDSAREEAFLKHVETRHKAYMNVIAKGEIPVPQAQIPEAGSGGTGTNQTGDKEVFNPDKLNNKTTTTKSRGTRKQRRDSPPVDGELNINLENVVVIPENLSGSALRKFMRDNPNAISQEDFDRIKKKQGDRK